MGDLILTEVLQGFRNDNHYQAAKTELERLPFEPMIGKHIALRSAENFRRLRKQRITIRKTIDVIIATFCSENDYCLLHSDRDFEAIKQATNLMTL